MKQNLPQNGLTQSTDNSYPQEHSQKVFQEYFDQEIFNEQFTPEFHREQNSPRVSNQIEENDFALTAKKRKKNLWNECDNQRLIRFHDELGNKWSAIALRFPGKTENDVKNRFFSRLRMGLRHLNKVTTQLIGKKNQVIKPSVLYKIISACEGQPKRIAQSSQALKQLAKQLKVELYNFLTTSQLKKTSQVYELVQKIRQFIALKNPHIKTKKLRLQPTFITTSHSESMSQESERVAEQTKKESICCKIKLMKTMQQYQNEQPLKQLSFEHLQTNQNVNLIQKPSICLSNPFEQLSFWMPHDQNTWSIDQRIDQYSFMAMCYQELIFPNNQSLL